MNHFVTPEQLRITTHATGFFRQLIESPEVVPMFRMDGESLSVGLAYSEAGHSYIVRESVEPRVSMAAIYTVCERLAVAMVRLYANTKRLDDALEGR